MAKASKGVTVFEVMVDGPGEGPAGDGTYIRRFRSQYDAVAFASGKTCWGRPAEVIAHLDVSRQLAARWGI
jgi:hypothetical protein